MFHLVRPTDSPLKPDRKHVGVTVVAAMPSVNTMDGSGLEVIAPCQFSDPQIEPSDQSECSVVANAGSGVRPHLSPPHTRLIRLWRLKEEVKM